MAGFDRRADRAIYSSIQSSDTPAQVQSSNKAPYLCLPGFCSCHAYRHQVAMRSEALVCKHELAVLLAQVVRKKRRSRQLPARRLPSACLPTACLLPACRHQRNS